jgi:hypothetical protein
MELHTPLFIGHSYLRLTDLEGPRDAARTTPFASARREDGRGG